MTDKAAKNISLESSSEESGNGSDAAEAAPLSGASSQPASSPASVESMTPAGVTACWSCRGPVMMGDLFCSTCEAIQPPRPVDPFARLGLEPGFEVLSDELDRCYFDLQRRLHPDRFATKSNREQAISVAFTADINVAYEILQDPVKRAIALLEMSGVAIHDESSNTLNDPVLLMEAMEQREALAEAKTSDQVKNIAAVAAREKTDCLADLADAFGKNDLSTADRLTTKLKYLVKFEGELRVARVRFPQTTLRLL
jgi:molecular chaperone HscB